MRDVVILGVGIHKFAKSWDKTIDELSGEAAMMAIKDAGINPMDIEAGFVGNVYEFAPPGPRAFGQILQTGIPITKIETACASSTRALGLCYQLISAGVYDMCMVIGVEKMPRGPIAGLGAGGYGDIMGTAPPPGAYALMAMRHMKQYGTKREHFAYVSVKSHKNATMNPYAQYQKEMTMEEVLNSRVISYPSNLYECSPSSDGAAAAIICSKEKAKQYSTRFITMASYAAGGPLWREGEPVYIAGYTPDMAKEAYERAGIGPEDVNVAQVHDAFSPAEIFEVEDLGFCPHGEGGPFVWEGNTGINGKIPVNTDGGLLSRGHPLGATGLAMLFELVMQLRGEAGPRQVKDPKVALLQNGGVGGGVVEIFKS